ncbi:MAG TPA: peptidoglycan DD-metalloendopeptidase family protein [Phototrophicaceae bacterium]|nr:peptidoglycan DD-metalloendopeptidase family protein [Phototrophicaceae bacterium]
MAGSNFIVNITGNPNVSTITTVNVRALPSTVAGTTVLFQAAVGVGNLPILDVQPDQANNALNGKVYQWFKVQFANGSAGWIRDDLVSIVGDGTSFGYPNLSQQAYAFGLTRKLLPPTGTSPAPTPPAPTPPTPTPPAPTPPAPTPPTPTPPPAPTPPSTTVTATVIAAAGLNMRSSPVTGNPIAKLAYHEQVTINGAQPQPNTAYIWALVQSAEGRGWARTDYLSISGDGSRFGLSKGDEYPAPLHSNYWWVRGQNDVQPNGSIDQHLGWDFSANPGQPIYCGPKGGWVMKVLTCIKCTVGAPSSIQQGHPVNDPAVLNDPAWGNGFGNAPIIRYTNDLLPASTQARLVALGMPGAHLFVIYGHMSAVTVQQGQTLGPNAQIGVIGNTGNSTATHVHVEVHASLNANDTNFAGMREFDPVILYLR